LPHAPGFVGALVQADRATLDLIDQFQIEVVMLPTGGGVGFGELDAAVLPPLAGGVFDRSHPWRNENRVGPL
jgi:hypothetical protein